MGRISFIYIVLMVCAAISGCTKDPIEQSEALASRSGSINATIVANDGDDLTGDGSEERPYLTLKHAVEQSGDGVVALRGGEYFIEDGYLDRVSGVTIMAYPDEVVTIKGTRLVTTEWERYSGSIYVTEPGFAPWQLFEGGEMLNAARYPNVDGFIEDQQPVSAYPNSGSLWDQSSTWILSSSSSSLSPDDTSDPTAVGTMIPAVSGMVSGAGCDLTGAIAILNVGSFKSSYAEVQSHSGDSFTYLLGDMVNFVTWQKASMSYCYLEGKLELLDRAGEWFYDVDSGRLYVWCKDGQSPDNIEGRVQSYAITLNESSNVVLSGLNFWGTTIYGYECNNITINSCRFTYPSYSRRMIREGESESGGDNYINSTSLINKNGSSSSGGHVVLNSIFEYSEGEALVVQGPGNTISNNIFRHIDFSCVNLRNIGGSVNFLGSGNIFSNNTLYVAGASETLLPGASASVLYNEIYTTGLVQNDGSICQFMIANSPFSLLQGNWFHNTVKTAMRVDGEKDPAGDYVWEAGGSQTACSIIDNVFWNTSGIMIKGDYHQIVNNTIFSTDPDIESNVYIINNTTTGGSNPNSVCYNNLVDMISNYNNRDWDDSEWGDGVVMNNYIGYLTNNLIITDILQDYINLDFRILYEEQLISAGITLDAPVDGMVELDDLDISEGSGLDIGAIEYNTQSYTIAGHQESTSSSPIPADGGYSDAGSLMLAWKAAYESSSSILYMGTSSGSLQQIATLPEGTNCYYPDKSSYPLNQRCEQIFWRVDSIVGGESVLGDVWSFSL